MGDGTGGAARVVTREGSAATADMGVGEGDLDVAVSGSAAATEERRATTESRRRFIISSLVATAVTAVPYVWILWGLWGSPDPLRQTIYEENFYDLQARAMFHGHLWLANGSIGIEAFVHGGHQYTYFGLFPSIIRMPILAVTSSLDGRLTAPCMLLAWLLTALFVSLLLWRVRMVMRGGAILGRLEATAFGLLIATVLGGTILMFLAATPFVFNEDLAWSVCLTIGSLFALLGVVERPSWGRVAFSFVLVLAANLDRATTGWACVAAAVLIGIWFGLKRLGAENRRWCLPMVGVGIVPLAVGCAVNYSKFGVLFGVSNYEQVWTHVNAYRRKFLAANHNAEEGIIFVPSNLLAYLRPDGIHLTSYFPFITLPPSPATALSGVLFDRRYRTASLPSSTPLLFLLSLWGLVTAFRPHPLGRVALTRILLLSAGGAGAALMLWGYIAPRYLGDFVPFITLASAVAMVDIWRRLQRRPRSVRLGATVVIGVVALYCVAANIGMAITPNEEWNTTQVLNFVDAQKSVSDLTGTNLSDRVQRGGALPTWAPADQLYVVGACSGLYISNGEDYSTVPSEQFQRTTWMAVERGPQFQHTFHMTFLAPPAGSVESVSLVRTGSRTVEAHETLAGPGRVMVIFGLYGRTGPDYAGSVVERSGSSHDVVVTTDTAKHLVEVTVGERAVLDRSLIVGTPIVATPGVSRSAGSPPALTAVNTTPLTSGTTLCRSLLRP
jgi:hypothetical protein